MPWQAGRKFLDATPMVRIDREHVRDSGFEKEYKNARRMQSSIRVPVSTCEVGIVQSENLEYRECPPNIRPASAWDSLVRNSADSDRLESEVVLSIGIDDFVAPHACPNGPRNPELRLKLLQQYTTCAKPA